MAGGYSICPECGAEVKKDNLQKHIRKVHGEGGDISEEEFIDAPERPKASGGSALLWLGAIAVCAIILLVAFWPIMFPDESSDEGGMGGNTHNRRAVLKVKFENQTKTIIFEIYEDLVPRTAGNFINYTNANYYNNLVFHRVMDDFMIQGGGYYRNANGELVERDNLYPPIKLEVRSDLKHLDGAVAMARTNDPNSATSQFYICDGAQTSLDGQYAVFGQVISGMEVVREIAKTMTHSDGAFDDVPVQDVTIQSLKLQ